jgi:ABC-type transport system substrate-binding protein
MNLMSRVFFSFLLACVVLSSVSCRPASVEKPPGDGELEGKDPIAAEAPNQASATSSIDRSKTLGEVAPAKDDALVLYYADDPDTLNLLTSNDTVSTAFQQQVYESFASQNFANPDEWEPSLATSWETSADGLEYTIHLRKGVKWHPMKLPNGKALPPAEFTAKDVKFTFDCILNPSVEAASQRSYYEDPDAKDEASRYKIKVTVVDDHTVKIRWTKPYFLADQFTLGVPMIPRHVYSVDENGEPISFDFKSKEFADGFNNHWANTKMCGTGPMIFKNWDKSERVTLERNEAYWGPPYFFSQIIYRHISNQNTALQQILQNELDFGAIPEKDHYIQSKSHENVKNGKVKLEEFAYPGYRYLGFNLTKPIFQDKKVRWAISHAVPVEQIIEKVYYGLADRLTGPFLPGSSSYNSELKPVAYDLEKAKSLLEEAGWTDTDSDGVRDKLIDGKKVSAKFDLMIYSDSPQYLTIAELIKENCRKAGIEVLISPTKWALMLQKLRKKEFDATILGWALNWKNDPFQIWHGSQADVPDSSNSISYKNPKVDELIETLRVTLDPQEQTKLYHEIHRLIYEDQPYTFLFMDRATAGRDARLQNVKFYKIRPGVDTREWYSSQPRIIGR